MPKTKDKKKRVLKIKRSKALKKTAKNYDATGDSIKPADSNSESDYKIIFSWETVDFIKSPRMKFYITASVIGSMGMIIWGISTRSFTMILMFIMLAAVSIMVLNEPSQRIRVKITEEGININDNHFEFKDFKSFKISLMHDMPVLSLFRKENYLPPKMVYIEGEPAKDLADFLGIYLLEE